MCSYRFTTCQLLKCTISSFVLQSCSVDRLNNIRIGVSDIKPSGSVPPLHVMTVCACLGSPFELNEKRAFPCGATGRYVIIMLEKFESLTLCEVEVFGGKSFLLKGEYPLPFACFLRLEFRI